MGEDPSTGELRVADIAVRGLRPSRLAVLGDASVTHPFGGRGQARGSPSPASAVHTPLAAASHRERDKVRRYGVACQAAGYDFVPLVSETYGGLGEALQRFLLELADRAVQR